MGGLAEIIQLIEWLIIGTIYHINTPLGGDIMLYMVYLYSFYQKCVVFCLSQQGSWQLLVRLLQFFV